MFNEEKHPAARAELLEWAAVAVARANEWPTVPTRMFGLIVSSRPASPKLSRRPERLFVGQCPKTFLMHVETHCEMRAPALTVFALRATEVIARLRADAGTLPAPLKFLRPASEDVVRRVGLSGVNESSSIRRLVASPIEPLPRFSRSKKR
jgi:hypothetical protein